MLKTLAEWLSQFVTFLSGLDLTAVMTVMIFNLNTRDKA